MKVNDYEFSIRNTKPVAGDLVICAKQTPKTPIGWAYIDSVNNVYFYYRVWDGETDKCPSDALWSCVVELVYSYRSEKNMNTTSRPSAKALKELFKWIAFCRHMGSKESIENLCEGWWQHHDKDGNPVRSSRNAQTEIVGVTKMPNPTEEDLNDPMFEAIWQTIKGWDVNVPDYYSGYCGASGSHVMLILKAIRSLKR